MRFWIKVNRKISAKEEELIVKEATETAEKKEETTKKENKNKFILEVAIILLAVLGLALLYFPIIGGTMGLVILVKLIREKDQSHWAIALIDRIIGKGKDD